MSHQVGSTQNLGRITRLTLGLFAASLLAVFGAFGCGDDEPERIEIHPEERGERGESCTARNECEQGLACINSTCTEHDYGVAPEAGHCEISECLEDEECCPDLIGDDDCQQLEDDCDEGMGDPFACDQYEQQCVCDYNCEDETCVLDEEECEDDTDCFGMDESCEDGQCVECTSDGDCDGDEVCIEGTCDAGCKVDANCPMFYSCEGGECVDTGCDTDRECIHYTNHHRAECNDDTGSCNVPCDNDADCEGGSGLSGMFFQVCEEGQCVFIGCESDEECRTALQLEGTANFERARCVED